MPRQLLHSGREFHLLPFETEGEGPEDSGAPETADKPVNYAYRSGWPDTGTSGDGVVLDREPSLYLGWSKARDDAGENSPDSGFVYFQLELTDAYLERLLENRRALRKDAEEHPRDSVPLPKYVEITVDGLTWRDLNFARKALGQARDDAFGKPE